MLPSSSNGPLPFTCTMPLRTSPSLCPLGGSSAAVGKSPIRYPHSPPPHSLPSPYSRTHIWRRHEGRIASPLALRLPHAVVPARHCRPSDSIVSNRLDRTIERYHFDLLPTSFVSHSAPYYPIDCHDASVSQSGRAQRQSGQS